MRIRTCFIRCAVVVYSNYVAEWFTLWGSNPTGLTLFSYFELRVRYNNNNNNCFDLACWCFLIVYAGFTCV